MDTFTISQLAQFAGIKPHTIRIWEQRYNALRPFRSEGNTRYYDNSQLRRLLNITTLNTLGYKVSELCIMKDEELFRLINDIQANTSVTKKEDYYISRLISSAMHYDEAGFEKTFAHCLLRFPMKELYTQVVYPMLQRVGMMWSGNEIPPGKEHFISNLLRQKLFTAIDALPLPDESVENRWICFLPEDEFHELGLLFASYIIRQSGQTAFYLGPNVPFSSLKETVSDIKATHLLCFLVTNNSPENNQSYINDLSSTFKKQRMFIAGNERMLAVLTRKQNVQWLQSIEELERQLALKDV